MKRQLVIAILAALFFSCGYVSNLVTKDDGTPIVRLPDLSSIATPDQADEAIYAAVKLYELYLTKVNRDAADKVGIDLYAAYVGGTQRGSMQSFEKWLEGRAEAGAPVPESAAAILRAHAAKMDVALQTRNAISMAFTASRWWRIYGDKRPFVEEYQKIAPVLGEAQ